MSGNNENTEIVRTIMSLAGNLGMDVTAEGVEMLDQVTKLKLIVESKNTNGSRPANGDLFDLSLGINSLSPKANRRNFEIPRRDSTIELGCLPSE